MLDDLRRLWKFGILLFFWLILLEKINCYCFWNFYLVYKIVILVIIFFFFGRGWRVGDDEYYDFIVVVLYS